MSFYTEIVLAFMICNYSFILGRNFTISSYARRLFTAFVVLTLSYMLLVKLGYIGVSNTFFYVYVLWASPIMIATQNIQKEDGRKEWVQLLQSYTLGSFTGFLWLFLALTDARYPQEQALQIFSIVCSCYMFLKALLYDTFIYVFNNEREFPVLKHILYINAWAILFMTSIVILEQ